MKWTKEQSDAIFKKGTNIIVSAGAGSGKTAVLTARTIETLKSGVKFDEMIILTFTKAAAFSMKEKIKKALKKENDSHLKEQLKVIEQASICTFDSFSLDLVKKYHDVLNFDQDITISDAVLIETIKNNIIDEVFLEFYDKDNFLKLLDVYTVKDDTNIKNDVKTMLNNLDKIYDINACLSNYIEVNFNDVKLDQDVKEYVNLIQQKYQEFLEKVERLSSFSTTKADEKILDFLNEFLEFNNYEDFKAFRVNFPRYVSKEDSNFKTYLAEVKEMFSTIQELAAYESTTQMKEEIKETEPYVEVIIDLLNEIIVRINKYKSANNLYEFNDITRLAINLLEKNEDIRNYYKHNIKEIMIDEYQDTNDIGDYFISLIANNNVFMVGDVKQSIYRFRNANPQIFIDKYNHYSNHIMGEKIDLNKNFRSRKETINNINLIFSKIMNEKIGGADYLHDHMMIFGQENYQNNDQNNNLEILNYNLKDYYGFNHEVVEAFLLALDIEDKIKKRYQVFDLESKAFRNMKYSDCAILLGQKTAFDLYKKVFNYFKIPLTIHKDEDLTFATELIVIKNIIKLIGYYQHIIEDNELIKTFMSVARSFVVKLNDQEIFKIIKNAQNDELFNYLPIQMLDKIIYLSDFSHKHSISELVEEVIRTFEIYEHLSSIGDVNLLTVKIDHLIEIAESLEIKDYHLKEFITYLIDSTNTDSFTISLEHDETIGVNLMTIHKSKGLEYPICYFADLNRKFSSRDIRPNFLFDIKYGFVAPIFKEGIKTTIYKELLKQSFITEEISERLRVLYVAFTRVKEKAIIVADLNKELEVKKGTIISDNIRLKYNSFNSVLLSLKDTLKDYIKDVEKINITRNYEFNNDYSSNEDNIDYDVLELDIKKEQINEKHYSRVLNTLGNNEMLELGTNIHELLEYLDFNDQNSVNKLKIASFFKEKIIEIYKMPFIIKGAIYHHEYEFIYNTDDGLAHGIIDLLVETDEELIVVDYKLKEIDKSYYIDQLQGYISYLKTLSGKKVKGYLYSIIDNKYIEV